jgi:ferrochelatase
MKPDQSSAQSAPQNERPANHPRVLNGRIGVLLVNLGTPDGTDYWSMRRYLKEFLSDRRVIETPRVIWWFILNLIILTVRPGRSGKKYETIWDHERNESPLKTITRHQAEKLEQKIFEGALGQGGEKVQVDWAMRYGNPSIQSRVKNLQDLGCDRLLIVPLYPQYASATSATVCDKTFDALKSMRWQPSIRIAPPYYDDPAYIEALAQSVRIHLAELDFEPDVILASFHGIPQSYFDKGDPYYCHCAKTTRLLAQALNLPADRLMMTFQSRFGPAKWLEPATEPVLEDLARRGIRKVAVLTPGFSADCLETIEEIGVEARQTFLDAGGTHYTRIACLNDGSEGMNVLLSLVERETRGWV